MEGAEGRAVSLCAGVEPGLLSLHQVWKPLAGGIRLSEPPAVRGLLLGSVVRRGLHKMQLDLGCQSQVPLELQAQICPPESQFPRL